MRNLLADVDFSGVLVLSGDPERLSKGEFRLGCACYFQDILVCDESTEIAPLKIIYNRLSERGVDWVSVKCQSCLTTISNVNQLSGNRLTISALLR